MAKKSHKKDHEHHEQADDVFTLNPTHLLIIVLTVAVIAGIAYTLMPGEMGPVVAKVNGEPVYLREVELRYTQMPAQYKEYMTKRDMLNSSIAEKLVAQEAKSLGIVVSDEQLAYAMEEVARASGMPKDALYARGEELGMSADELNELFRVRLLTEELFRQQLSDKLEVSDEEIAQYYAENIDLMKKPAEVRASHILVKTEEEANSLIAQLREGADFAKLASENTLDPSGSATGGDLGWFGKGRMVPEFEQVAFALVKGEVSSPVKTQFGWHVIKVTDKHAAMTVSLADAAPQIRSLLMQGRADELLPEYLDSLRAKANVKVYWKEKYNQ